MDEQYRISRRKRYVCEVCGEPATRRHTFLLKGTRTNPRSSAYGRDDCSRCSDDEAFACEEHEREVRNAPPEGMTWSGTYYYAPDYEPLFYRWVRDKETEARFAAMLAEQAAARPPALLKEKDDGDNQADPPSLLHRWEGTDAPSPPATESQDSVRA